MSLKSYAHKQSAFSKFVTQKKSVFADLHFGETFVSNEMLIGLHHSYAKSIISYGLLENGSAAKTNTEITENAQRRILRPIV